MAMENYEELKYLAEWLRLISSANKEGTGADTKINLISSSGEFSAVYFIPIVGDFTYMNSLRLLVRNAIIDSHKNENSQYDVSTCSNIATLLVSIASNNNSYTSQDWMDEETKFFIDIIMPIFKFIRDLTTRYSICEYTTALKYENNIKTYEFSSEDVYSTLKSISNKKDIYEFLNLHIESRYEFEELRRAFDNDDELIFAQRLAKYVKNSLIYSFCYHFNAVENKLNSLKLHEIYGMWIAIYLGQRCFASKQSIGINDRTIGMTQAKLSEDVTKQEYYKVCLDWFSSQFKLEPMYRLISITRNMLLYIDDFKLSEEQEQSYTKLLSIPRIKEIYNDVHTADPTSVIADTFFNSDISQEKQSKIINLITEYFRLSFNQTTQGQKSVQLEGVETKQKKVSVRAQVSVMYFLYKQKCLHLHDNDISPRIIHERMSLFIKISMGIENAVQRQFNEVIAKKDFADTQTKNMNDKRREEYKEFNKLKEEIINIINNSE